MRRNDKEVVDQNVINAILNNSVICRIALFDDEFPYIIPMNYGYRDNSLYFHCAQEGKKIDLIRKNNKVCFEIEQSHEILKDEISCKWTTKYRSIIGLGHMEIISDYHQKLDGLDVIMQQHGKKENEYNSKNVDNIFVLKLNINSISAKQSGDW